MLDQGSIILTLVWRINKVALNGGPDRDSSSCTNVLSSMSDDFLASTSAVGSDSLAVRLIMTGVYNLRTCHADRTTLDCFSISELRAFGSTGSEMSTQRVCGARSIYGNPTPNLVKHRNNCSTTVELVLN